MKWLLPKIPALFAVLLLATSPVLADPSSLDPWQLLSTGQMNELIRSLMDHNDAASYNLLARAYYASEQWDASIKNAERAVNLRPGDSDYHLWLGRAYGQKAADIGNPLSAANLARKAKNEFERAVQLDPNNVPARADLSEYYTEAPAIMGGGTDKARNQASQLQSLNPTTANWVRAIVAVKEKKYAEAESDYQRAIATAKNPAGDWMNLASFYRQQGRLDDMEKAIITAINLPNHPAVTYYDAAGELFRAGRNYPAAVQYLKNYLSSGQLVEDAPAFQAHYLLGQIYEKSGDKAQAASQYQASLSLASGFARARKALDQLH
jgi:tetratricopeptide (TPR) repeat protein